MIERELAGQVVSCTDYPNHFAFSPDGSLLVAAGSTGPVQFIDVAAGKVVRTTKVGEAKSLTFADGGKPLYVGAKTIAVVDVTTGKKSKLAFKGHKACPNSLALSPDGAVLCTAGGSYIYTDDCFVRAFDTKTGELLWKAKPGKKGGASGVAWVGDLVVASCDDGSVRAFNPQDGKLSAELCAVERESPHGGALAGIAAFGVNGAVVSSARGGVPTITWLRVEGGKLMQEGSASCPIIEADKGATVAAPLVCGDRVVLVVGYTVKDYSRSAAFVFDGAKKPVAKLVLKGAADARYGDVTADGRLAWGCAEGVALAKLP